MSFPDFLVNETADTKISQPYMQQYQNKNVSTNNGKLYKYLYDPDLSFNFRFYQRLAKIKYDDRKEPWISIMYNTGEVRPLTDVLSHVYDQIRIAKRTDTFYDTKIRRVVTPVNLVFISNDIDYLYSYLQKLSFYFDRITQYNYQQRIQYSDNKISTYQLSAMAKNIIQKDLTKLDTENRGSLATAGYSFDLIYYSIDTPLGGYLLKDIDINMCFVNDFNYMHLTHVHHHN